MAASPSPDAYSRLSARLDASKSAVDKVLEKYRKATSSGRSIQRTTDLAKEHITLALRDISLVAREAAREGLLSTEDGQKFVKPAAELATSIVDATHKRDYSRIFDYIPISCGNDVTDDAMTGHGVGAGLMSMLFDIFGFAGPRVPPGRALGSLAGNKFAPHSAMPKPSAHSSPLARFSLAPPPRRAFAEACCEVATECLRVPVLM